jgi:hypothetical protein
MRQALTVLAIIVAFPLAIWYGKASQRKANDELRTIEQQVVTVTDTAEKLKIVVQHDTQWVRVTVAKANSGRDSAQKELAELDSAAKADSLVSARLTQEAASAAGEALERDSVAIAAHERALADALRAKQWSDSGWALANQRAGVMERAAGAARSTGRKEGFAAGVGFTLVVLHFIGGRK